MERYEKVMAGLEHCKACTNEEPFQGCDGCPYNDTLSVQDCRAVLCSDALALLKESVPQGVVDQVRWERDTALSQLEEIGKGLGEKMDDIVALLKERDNEKKRIMKVIWDALHEGFSIDTIADQDWVYEQIRHRIEDI